MKTIFIKDHSENCYAVKNYNNNTWNTVWAYITDKKTRGAKNAPVRRGSSSIWIYARCNCTNCPAEIAILEESILVKLPNTAAEILGGKNG